VKIIQYLHTTDAGHRRYVLDLAEALAGTEDVVVLTARNAPQSTSVRQLNVLREPDPSKRGLARIVDRLRVYWDQPQEFETAAQKEVEYPGFNICHFQQLPSLFPYRIVGRARRAGYLTVITIHNVSPHETSGFITKRKQMGAMRAWRSADLVLVHSANLVNELVETAQVSSAKIAVVRHPIWGADSDAEEGGNPEGFLFFGHLREGKGLPGFIEALALLGNPKASIIGSGTERAVEEVRRQLENFHLTNCTFDPRFVSDAQVPAIFAQHRVLVAPYTHFAAQSGVTHLAATYGLATVVTAVGALPDLVCEYGVGEVAEPDARSLASAMSKAHSKACEGDYESGLARAREELSSDNIAKTLIQLYENYSLSEARNG
jgi:glycosyltransferase involved in cell wall biosynthesis